MKFEEVLPVLKNGKKIKRKEWSEKQFIYREGLSVCKEDGGYYYMDCDQLLCDDWEVFEGPDWDYIIKNKCLCWFWDDENYENFIARLEAFNMDDDNMRFKSKNGAAWRNCRPVRRDEVTFYEDKKDDI